MHAEDATTQKLRDAIRDVPDFPKEGIVFKDITTLLRRADLLNEAIDKLAAPFQKDKIQYVVGIESRGFIFGTALALKLKAGFIPVRKKGKLPAETKEVTYSLEYGEDTLEIHLDAIERGARVLISDDLLATGGTCRAVIGLLEGLGASVIGISFLIELVFLEGRAKFRDYKVASLIQY